MDTSAKEGHGGRRLPKGALASIALLYIISALSETVLFPFVALMVKGFHITEDPLKLGYYAGYVASSFYVGVLLSSGFWGSLSDWIGRKPVLLFSTVTTAATSLTFGFSSSLSTAMAARFCSGLLSGVYPVGKTLIAELTDNSNQASGYTVIGLSWGVGLLLGPALGGLFSQPAEKYPWLIPQGSLLDIFPFALPCIFISSLAVVSLGLHYFSLPETLGRAKTAYNFRPTAMEISTEAGSSKDGASGSKICCSNQDLTSGSSFLPKGTLLSHVTTEPRLREPLILKENSETEMGSIGKGGKGWAVRRWLASICGWEDEEKYTVEWRGDEKAGWVRAVFCERDTVLTTLIYAVLGFAATSQNEVFPLWAITEWSAGGLGFGTSEIGFIQAAGGFALIPYQMLFYPAIANYLGTLNCMRWSFVGMTLVAAFPILRFITSQRLRVAVGLLIMMIRGITCATAFTSITIAINNSVRYAEYLGSVNGMSQTANMMLESSAPLLGSSLYAWSVSGHHDFPLDFHLYWCLWVALCALMLLLTALLPKSIDSRKFIMDDSSFDE